MEPAREIGRMLLVFGVIFLIAGTLLTFGSKLPFRLGRLPGDITYQGRNTTIYFPVVTCLVASLGFSLVLWIISLFRR